VLGLLGRRNAHCLRHRIGGGRLSSLRCSELLDEARSGGTPEGCGGAYTVQFTADSSLVIWCRKSDANGVASAVASSHTTTYHLRFVRIPQTFRVDKGAGEATIIELAKQDGVVVMTGVR
jgi:hypothetical protein